MIRAVIFDLDETLHQRTPSLVRFARAIHEEFRPDADEAAFIETFLRLDQRGSRPREGLFTAIAERYRLDVHPQHLVDRFRHSAWDEPVLFADAIATLRHLRSQNYSVSIITNGSDLSQTAKTQNSGLVDS